MAMHVLNIMYNCTRVVRACILNNNKYIYHRHHTFHIQVCECVVVYECISNGCCSCGTNLVACA